MVTSDLFFVLVSIENRGTGALVGGKSRLQIFTLFDVRKLHPGTILGVFIY